MNEDAHRFCMQCGHPLEAAPAQTQVEETPPAPQQDSNPINQAAPPPQYQNPGNTYQPNPQLTAKDVGQAVLSYSKQKFTQQRGRVSTFNIWGPFAGYGTQRRHLGWLMDNKSEYTDTLVKKIDSKFQEREIPETDLVYTDIMAPGVLVPVRPYFLLKRGLVSVALYVTDFGKDLFISLASYLKPPFSQFRVILLILSVVFFFVGFPAIFGLMFDGLNSAFSPFGGMSEEALVGALIAICFLVPLAAINNLALFIFLCYSVFKWIKEKDFWAGLRQRPHEFNEDDLMAMEKAVEQTVRIALDEIGLDPNDLKPVDTGFGRRLI
jgi:hypothetical protein